MNASKVTGNIWKIERERERGKEMQGKRKRGGEIIHRARCFGIQTLEQVFFGLVECELAAGPRGNVCGPIVATNQPHLTHRKPHSTPHSINIL